MSVTIPHERIAFEMGPEVVKIDLPPVFAMYNAIFKLGSFFVPVFISE